MVAPTNARAPTYSGSAVAPMTVRASKNTEACVCASIEDGRSAGISVNDHDTGAEGGELDDPGERERIEAQHERDIDARHVVLALLEERSAGRSGEGAGT